VVQDDLMLLIHHFYNNSLRVDKLSHAMVYLLLKESNFSVIQKFRHISLVDCSYNFISKILTNRMAASVLAALVGCNVSEFSLKYLVSLYQILD
jgi:hypothetical protein